MQFVSLPFLLLVSLSLLIYYLLPRNRQWWVLLAASYLFYAFAGLEYLSFILYTTAVTYLTGILMQKRADTETAYIEALRETLSKEERKAYRAKAKKRRLHILTGGLLLGFGMLAVLKYTGFVLSGFSRSGRKSGFPTSFCRLAFPTTPFSRWGISLTYTAARDKPNTIRSAWRCSSLFFRSFCRDRSAGSEILHPSCLRDMPLSVLAFARGFHALYGDISKKWWLPTPP